MDKKEIFFHALDHIHPPEYASSGASGADIRAAILEELILHPSHSLKVPTGLFLEIPQGFEVQVRPRSGLAINNQITVLNTPGTVDADFRGEICVILINHGKEPFIITPNMRIAQLVVSPVVQVKFIKKNKLAQTKRGEHGFGHTGLQ